MKLPAGRMRQRGVSTLVTIALAALAGLTTAALLADWAVVRVRTPAPDAHHLMIPFPLVLGDVATAFLPDNLGEEAQLPPELKEQKTAILKALDALLDAEDSELVRVDSDEARVRLGIKGRELHIDVDAPDAKVFCRIPLKGLRKALEDWDFEKIEPGLILKTLHSARSGPLVKVDAEDGTYVEISTW